MQNTGIVGLSFSINIHIALKFMERKECQEKYFSRLRNEKTNLHTHRVRIELIDIKYDEM